LERAHAYAEAGADGFFVPGLADLALIANFDEGVALAGQHHGQRGRALSALAKRGVARVSYGADPYIVNDDALQEAAHKAKLR